MDILPNNNDNNNRRPRLKQQKTLTETTFLLTFITQITWLSSEVECNPKMSLSFFDDLGGLFLHLS